MEVSYLKHTEIDEDQWDHLILNSPQGNVYGLSWFLDAVAPEWNALIHSNKAGDYLTVMPLPANTKWSIRSVYTPIIAQQLGLFSCEQLNQQIFNSFIDAIPDEFKKIRLAINQHNNYSIKGYNKIAYPNFILPLDKSYDEISKKYNSNTSRNVKKVKRENIKISPNISPESCVKLFKENKGSQLNFSEEFYFGIVRIMYQSIHRGFGKIYGVYDERNQLMASAFFVFAAGKIYYLFPASNSEGRKKNAMFLLIDSIIEEYAETEQTLDFEGSAVEGVARFYKGFGAVKIEYWHIEKNDLPFYLNWPFKFYSKLKGR